MTTPFDSSKLAHRAEDRIVLRFLALDEYYLH